MSIFIIVFLSKYISLTSIQIEILSEHDHKGRNHLTPFSYLLLVPLQERLMLNLLIDSYIS